MKKKIAHRLRRIAERLDPPPASIRMRSYYELDIGGTWREVPWGAPRDESLHIESERPAYGPRA